jgi:hypothetical protein
MAQTPKRPDVTADHSWTITGASAETRAKVKAAADAEGMTIRAWVDRTLNDAADGKAPRAKSSGDDKALAEVSAKLDDVIKRLPENAKAAEKETAQRLSAQVLKSVAAGFQEMARTAKDQARIAEGKPPKKKAKPAADKAS